MDGDLLTGEKALPQVLVKAAIEDLLVVTITIASALPSGSQSYYFAYRYNAQKDLISSNIVLSTFVSFFTISLLFFFFGY